MPNPACVAYEAYRKHQNESGKLDVYLVGWQYISDHEKKAWWKVVESLIKMKGPPNDATE